MTLLAGINYMDRVRSMISAHGWAVQTHRGPDGAQVAYTVGVTSLGGPEVLVRDLEPSAAREVLNAVAPALLTGQVAVSHWLTVPGPLEGGRTALLRLADDLTDAPIVRTLYGEAARVVEVCLKPATSEPADEPAGEAADA